MESIPVMKHDALRPAVPSVQLALEHVDSDDYFQQMLSFDSALQALLMSKDTLELKLEAVNDRELTDEARALQQSLTETDTLLRRFEGYQTAARDRFSLRARSLRKVKKGILDLPNELLQNIFDNLRNDDIELREFSPDFGYKVNTMNIQNVRLAHRRFLQTSSHLLIRYLDVSLSTSSLERLEQVMRHPEISKGKRLLRIDMRYYSASMAENFGWFARTAYSQLQNMTESLEATLRYRREKTKARVSVDGMDHIAMGEAMSGDNAPQDTASQDATMEDAVLEDAMSQDSPSDDYSSEHPLSEHPVLEDGALEDAATKARRILSSWAPFMYEGPTVEAAHLVDEAGLALRRGHERYRALHMQQKEILQDGRFARAVAAAAARGHSGGRPRVWLHMSDGENKFYKIPPKRRETAELDLLADLDLLVQSMGIEVGPWVDADDAPQSLLYEVPLAMRAVGVSLAGLRIDINMPFTFDLSMSQEQLSGLREVAQTLETFTFNLDEEENEGPDSEDSPKTFADFYAYLSAAMGQQNVPRLELCIEPSENFFRIGPLLASPSWQRLEMAYIDNISMSIHELRRLMGMLEPGVWLRLSKTRLTSGTWAAALDCLRSKAGRGSYLNDARGAESDEMSDEDHFDIFGHVGPWVTRVNNKATQYITSVEGVKNPLRRNDEWIEADPEL